FSPVGVLMTDTPLFDAVTASVSSLTDVVFRYPHLLINTVLTAAAVAGELEDQFVRCARPHQKPIQRCALVRWFSCQRRNSRNSASRCSCVNPATAGLCPFRKAANSPLSPCASATSLGRMRLSISSAGAQRIQPGTLAARLTSRHFGWRGGSRNLSHLVNRFSTNR